jgi:hypothetical protein
VLAWDTYLVILCDSPPYSGPTIKV